MRYEDESTITIMMTPGEFARVEERDKFFGGMKSTLLRESAEVNQRRLSARVCGP